MYDNSNLNPNLWYILICFTENGANIQLVLIGDDTKYQSDVQKYSLKTRLKTGQWNKDDSFMLVIIIAMQGDLKSKK